MAKFLILITSMVISLSTTSNALSHNVITGGYVLHIKVTGNGSNQAHQIHLHQSCSSGFDYTKNDTYTQFDPTNTATIMQTDTCKKALNGRREIHAYTIYLDGIDYGGKDVFGFFNDGDRILHASDGDDQPTYTLTIDETKKNWALART